MSALGKVVRSGVGRRRVQSLVLALTTFAAVTSSVLSLGLLLVVQAPFEHAFRARNGAHLSVQFDGSKATAAQAAATAHTAGVTEASGPYPVTAALDTAVGTDCTRSIAPGMPWAGRAADPVVATTRPDLAGTSGVDRLALLQGRWPTGANEIVLSSWVNACASSSVVFDSLPGKPSFKVVGLANSLTNTATGFLTTDGFARLTAAGARTDQEMLYRFAASGTDADLATDKRAITAAAPAGSVESGQSYLAVEKQAVGATKSYVPFLVVFGVLGLFLSVLIIAIVVSGAVVSGIRRIGILKSLGFTPWQVARAYAAQALIPAAVGVLGGTLFGNVLAVPVLGKAGKDLGAADTGLPVWVSLVVPVGTLVIVGVTALVPALRAGRLPAVQVLVVGRAPGARRGQGAQRLASRLPLPRPMSLGLAQPFAKPARTVLVGAAVLFGAVSVTFATGLESAFTKYSDTGSNGINAGPVIVVPAGMPDGFHSAGGPTNPHLDSTKVAAALASIPGTKAAFGWGASGATVIGAPTGEHATVDTTTGDLSWTKLPMLHGRLHQNPGEAVVNDHLASATGMHVGDTVTVAQDDKRLPLRIVGIDFDASSDGVVMTDSASFTAAGLTPYITQFNVEPADHVGGSDWSRSAAPALTPLQAQATANIRYVNPTVLTMIALVATLTLMMVAVAALGVLNTVVQDTRERIHDLGIFKALGMTPRQTVTMVLTSVSLTGLIAGLIGVPIGMAAENLTLSRMGSAIGKSLPPSVTHVYTTGLLLPLLAGGIAIALLGAVLPAGWAARSRTATALRTE
ncbi:ABC transporter permease [Kitasatospora sp. NPDC006697]|uniref:ABC transporter permease n=1 Tax=Kitasatospora sp. NPDC006697 TaxID=3364020 RepID=UPI0036B03F3B